MFDFLGQYVFKRQLYLGRRSITHVLWPMYKLVTHEKVTGVGPVVAVLVALGLSTFAVHHSWTMQGIVPSKLLKYIPIDAGGNIQFPLTIIMSLGWRFPERTRWNSFDQRSFFPHRDLFKLQTAITEANLPLLKTVLDRGKVDINAEIREREGTTAIGLAAMLGRTIVMEYLRDRGADINKPDKFGNTPLMLAVVHQQDTALQFLVESGADLSPRDKYGFSAIDKAANRGFTQIQAYLSSQSQHKTAITVNPITPTLERFGELRKPSAKRYYENYDPGTLLIGQEYPYFRNTQGMLVSMFGNFDRVQWRGRLGKWTKPNPMDEKASTSQDFLAFGKFLMDNLETEELATKALKTLSQGKGA
jgi:hypothetical protein